ncbi:MAG: arylesterase [Pleurocapsa sp.]
MKPQDKKKKKWVISFLALSSVLLANCENQSLNRRIQNLSGNADRTIVILGDSITAGYGLNPRQAYPYLLSEKFDLPILNRGVSGDTTADGLARLKRDVLSEKPWLVIIALGANDFLTQVPTIETEKNLKTIVRQIQKEKAIVVILGMNFSSFTDEYQEMYTRVARETDSYLIPQVLQGVLDNSQYSQADMIHPNALGQEIIANRIAEALKPILEKSMVENNKLLINLSS